MKSTLIAICGGIGSGKSIVSRMLRALGFPVYDCDTRAKQLMASSDEIKCRLSRRFGSDVLSSDGSIDRKHLAKIVFGDADALSDLNRIVHGAVRADLEETTRNCASEVQFVETAILYQSGIDLMVDEVWEVMAPPALRIERVTKRSGLSEEEVEARIRAQDAFEVEKPHPNVKILVNDGYEALLPQLEKLLSESLSRQ